MKHLYCLLFIVSGLIAVSGQCDDYLVNGSQVFHANEVRTVIHTGGDMFWDHDNGAFQVPYKGPESATAMYSAAVWLGGYDDQGNLRLSAQKFRLNRLEYQEYQPGPLVAPGVPFSTDCAQWDIIWSVTRAHTQSSRQT